ncbi:MAG: hypothetical protein R3202_05730, partial [Candidatus Competibacterales bacterium]|nr:hypothetical protein [Candidatus Competibacterales bacterium]
MPAVSNRWPLPTGTPRHLLALSLCLLFNPALYFANSSGGIMTPDAVAYLVFARDLFDTGRLYLAGWGSPDSGLILPPLYPALVAVLGMFEDDLVQAAEWTSTLCLLLATVPLYQLTARRA